MAKKAKNKVQGADTLSGFNIFKDEHDRYIYFNRFDHSGYVVDNNIRAYKNYSSRFIIAMLAGFIAFAFNLGVLISIVCCALVYIVMEVKFRMFLNKLPVQMNFQPKKRTSYVSASSVESYNKIYLRLALYILFAVLVVLNAVLEEYDMFMLIASCAFGIAALVLAGLQVRTLLYKKSQPTTPVKKKKK